MNIYDALSNDQRHFEAQLDRLVAATRADDDQWKATLDELRRDVTAHAHAEEVVFYNALRKADQAKELVLHSFSEHVMAKGEIRTLDAAVVSRSRTSATVPFRTGRADRALREHPLRGSRCSSKSDGPSGPAAKTVRAR